MVRSGVDKIGFLNDMNRRCVAQSRAKCGMYFVGNAETIGQSNVWKPLITQMKVTLYFVSYTFYCL
jgi:superfamily I DNA and/or RNA helicase